MLRTALLTLLVAALQISFLHAQSSRAMVTQPIEWFSAASTIKVSDRIGLLTEGQFRFARQLEPMQFQIRNAIDVTLSKHWSIAPVGYVFTLNPLYGKQPNSYVNNEHRLYQQIVFKHHSGKFALNYRVRMEQRFTQVHRNSNGEVINDGYTLFTNRARFRFQLNVALNKPRIEEKTMYLSLYNETFMSFGKNVVYHEPDQNRIFAGVGYQITKLASVQVGALYQYLVKAGGTKQENNIGLSFSVVRNIEVPK